jgi:hypothetical protein
MERATRLEGAITCCEDVFALQVVGEAAHPVRAFALLSVF